MKRILALLFAVLLLSLSGCAAPKSDELKNLDVVLDWYPNALHAFLYVGMEKGYFEEEGLALTLRFPSNSNDAISLVAAGQADIGLYYQQDIIQTVAKQKVPVKSLGAIVQYPLNIVLSLKEKGIDSPEDLVGKRVGYAGTELSEAIIQTLMESVGADPSTVKLTDVGFDLMSSMTTGNVDATIGCLRNHEVPQMIEEGFEVQYFEFAPYGVPNYYEMTILSSDRMIDSDPETLKKFLRACEKSFRDVQSDPEGALDILMENQNAENFPLSRSVEESSLDVLLPLMETQDMPFLSQKDEDWQKNIDWMYNMGLIPEKVTPDEVRVELDWRGNE